MATQGKLTNVVKVTKSQYDQLKNGGSISGYGEYDSNAIYLVDNPLLDLIYPIGSIYMSVNGADPATLFGGTWSRIQGQFLLGATGNTSSSQTGIQGNASVGPGGQGGEASHQLTTSELPANIGTFTALRWASNTGESGRFTYTQRHSDRTLSYGDDCGDALYTLSGGNASHNNMPPFLAVYIWKRTA